MELFKLFGTILVDNEKANASMYDTEKQAGEVANKFVEGAKTAVAWGAGIAAAATAAGVAILSFVQGTVDASTEIELLSERTGISTTEVQRWQYALNQSGTDASQLQEGVKKLNEVLAESSDETASAFQSLGLSMNYVKNSSPEEMFDAVITRLADMPPSVEKNAIGNQLLGESYVQLLPLLNQGSKGIAEIKAEADRLGIVMSEDMVKGNAAFGDTMKSIDAALAGVKNSIASGFMPYLQAIADFILQNMPAIQGVIEGTVDFIAGIIGPVFSFLGELFTWLVEIDNATGGALSTVLKFAAIAIPAFLAFNKVTDMLSGFKDMAGIAGKAVDGVGSAGGLLNAAAENTGFFGFVKWAAIIAGVAVAVALLINQLNVLLGKGHEANQVFSTIGSLAGGGGMVHGSHSTGLNYVPFDGYVAELHKGEAVITAKDNPYTRGVSGGDTINIYANVKNYSDLELLIKESKEKRQRVRAGGESYA